MFNMKPKQDMSIFLEYMGDTPQLRVLDFLMENHFFDYPMTGITKGSNVGYSSLQKIFPKFIKSEIVIKTRRVGKSDYFKLNMEHPFIKSLWSVYWNLIKTENFPDEIGKIKEVPIINN